MAEQTVTFRGEYVSDIAEGAKKDAAALQGLDESAKKGATAHEKLANATTGGSKALAAHADHLSGATRAQKEYAAAVERTRKRVEHFGHSITEKMHYPLQQLTWTLQGATAGMVAFGIASFNAIQASRQFLMSYTGSGSMGNMLNNQLMGMQGPLSLQQLGGAFTTLAYGGGMGLGGGLRTLASLNQAGMGVYGAGAAPYVQAAAGALANARQTGVLSSQQAQSIVDLYGKSGYSMLGQVNGMSPTAIAQAIAEGDPLSGQGLNGLINRAGLSKTGEATFRKINPLGFFWEKTKVNMGHALAQIGRPLFQWLANSEHRINDWAQGVANRAKTLGSQLAQEVSSGNWNKFSETLGMILGGKAHGKAVGHDVQVVVNAIQGIVQAMKNLAQVAGAVWRAFSPLVRFIDNHGALVSFVLQFAVLAKTIATIARVGGALRDLSLIGAGGARTGLLGGGSAATEGVGATAESSGLIAAAAAVGAYLVLKNLKNGGWMPGGKHAPGWENPFKVGPHTKHPYNKDIGNFLLGAYNWVQGQNLDAKLFGMHTSPGGHATHNAVAHSRFGDMAPIHVNQVNVTIPGSGNPAKVANSVANGLSQNTRAAANRAARRAPRHVVPTPVSAVPKAWQS